MHGCRTCRVFRRTVRRARCRKPASRSTRFSRIGRLTSQCPYSLTTQTRAPTARGSVEQRGTGIVELADQTRHVAAGRARTAGGHSRGAADRPASARAGRSRESRRRIGRSSGCRAGPRSGPRRCETGTRPSFCSSRSHRPSGVAGDAEHLVAVGPIIRLGRHADLDRRPLVEPPEELGRTEWQPSRRARASAPSRRSARPG